MSIGSASGYIGGGDATPPKRRPTAPVPPPPGPMQRKMIQRITISASRHKISAKMAARRGQY
jgi:hypothetical protein